MAKKNHKEVAVQFGRTTHVTCFEIEEDLDKSHWMKTCPRCSKERGMLVFKPYPEAFGESEARGPGKTGAQSHCLECRSKK